MVRLDGSPPNDTAISLVHSRASRWSQKPWFPMVSLALCASSSSSEPYRNPNTPSRYAGATTMACTGDSVSPIRAAGLMVFGDPD